MAVRKENFRRLLLTFEALAELGPVLTGEGDFAQTARTLVTSVLDAMGAREGALFSFNQKPALLKAVAVEGFPSVSSTAAIPLLPRHVHALQNLQTPEIVGIGGQSPDNFFSANGNVAPALFKVVSALRFQGRLVGVLALGQRQDEALYGPDELDALGLVSHYCSLAVHSHIIRQSLEQRVSENLRLLASLHTFYDNALEAFAAAIDIKHVNIRGHSLRVGRYAAGIGEAIGMTSHDVAGLRAAGYLHDIGKVAVDKHLFGKTSKLDPEEFREMADHTTVGHRIVQGVEFPWPNVPEVVRSHHERADASGYPDRISLNELSTPTRIVAVADVFDAMVTDRPYRDSMSVGAAISEIVHAAPQKFDAAAVQGLLIQLRREACGSNQAKFLDDRVECNIGAADIDQLSASLSYRLTNARAYSA